MTTRKIVMVDMPDKPEVEKFVLIERPGITYVNTACKCRNGVVQIIAPESAQIGEPINMSIPKAKP